MINFVIALPAEAKPIISYYRLKQIQQISCFQIFTNASYRLIISGVGKIAASTATAYLQGLFPLERSIWINLGIAGHRHYSFGETLLAHKITDLPLNKSWYPQFLFSTKHLTTEVLTVDRPESLFTHEGVYDMEASGFYQAACHFSIIEFIHSIKIVSDNQQSGYKHLTAALISDLIATKLPLFDEFISNLKSIKLEFDTWHKEPDEANYFFKNWHFTVSEQHYLKKLLKKWQVLSIPLKPLEVSKQCKNAKDVLNLLENKLQTLIASNLS